MLYGVNYPARDQSRASSSAAPRSNGSAAPVIKVPSRAHRAFRPLPCAAPRRVLEVTGADFSEQRTQSLGHHHSGRCDGRSGGMRCNWPERSAAGSGRPAPLPSRCGCSRTSPAGPGWFSVLMSSTSAWAERPLPGGWPGGTGGAAQHGRAASSTSTGPSQVPYPAGTQPPTRSRCACAISRPTTASGTTGRWRIPTSIAGVPRSPCNSGSLSSRVGRPQAGTRPGQERPEDAVGRARRLGPTQQPRN